MRKLIKWLVSVILTVGCLDAAAGWMFRRYVASHTLPGDYESIEQVLRHSNSDLLVLGSSVALNSIDTKMLEDSLHISSFSGGGNGQTFPFYLTMLKAAVAGHKPRKVILAMGPSALTTSGVGSRYNIFAPYYGMGIADIDENLDSMRKHNSMFMKSFFLRLNTIWFRILLYHFVTPDLRGENGHVAKPVPPVFPTKHSTVIDPMPAERMQQFEEFMRICKDNDIELTVIFTPEYVDVENPADSSNAVHEAVRMAGNYGFKVYCDTGLEPFASSPELFYDNSHINVRGTKIYTDTILNRIR